MGGETAQKFNITGSMHMQNAFILQAGTGYINGLAENTKWSRVWQYLSNSGIMCITVYVSLGFQVFTQAKILNPPLTTPQIYSQTRLGLQCQTPVKVKPLSKRKNCIPKFFRCSCSSCDIGSSDP